MVRLGITRKNAVTVPKIPQTFCSNSCLFKNNIFFGSEKANTGTLMSNFVSLKRKPWFKL